MKRIFLIILGLCLPVLALADTNLINILNPPAISNGTDLSISYLGDMFGVVDGVLHGSGSQIMGQMFMVFNAGALILGGIIVIYTTLISLLNTAHEGEFLGRKWNSIWIPLRTVIGIALLVPKATGYCGIQIFMMWVIVQGVGLADTIWNQATNYLVAGGVIVQQSLAPSQNVADQTKNLFRQSVCLDALQTEFNNAYQQLSQKNQNPPPVPNFTNSINPLNPTCSGNTCKVTLPDFPKPAANSGQTDWSGLNGACGTITWDRLSVSKDWLANLNALGNKNLKDAYEQALEIGVQQIILDMSGPAQSVDNLTLNPPNAVSGEALSTYLDKRMFLDTSEDYEGIVYPAQRIMINIVKEGITMVWAKSANTFGWIDAGAYYQLMANADDGAGQAIFSPPKGLDKGDLGTQFQQKMAYIPGVYAPYINTASLSLFLAEDNSALNSFISSAPSYDAQYGDTAGVGGVGDGSVNVFSQIISQHMKLHGAVAKVLDPVLGPLVEIFQGFIGLATSQATNANPVVMIALMGTGLIQLVVEVWITGAVTIAVATGALAAVPMVAEGIVVNAVVEWIVPFLWAICGLLFVEGTVMAYYVPMIPYILFLFGAIGWLIATLEAMVAAPLVALGITHPEGAEILGKADPAVLLLVNVFLRPSMMIIGFIGGIILSYVALWLLNVGFFGAFVVAVFQNLNLLSFLFAIPGILIAYTGICIAVMNTSFSLINVVPDKVMRWVSGQVEGVAGEASRMLGEVKQGHNQFAQSSGQGMSELAKASGGRGDKSINAKGTETSSGDGGGKFEGQKAQELQMTETKEK